MKKRKQNRIFMDFASSTPIDERVVRAMRPFSSSLFANPSAIYKEGVLAKKALAQSRESVARSLSAHADEIVFTASGTESVNLAILGSYRALSKKHKKPHIISSSLEHPAVIESLRVLKNEGCDVTLLSADSEGRISPTDLRDALREETILVTVMYANNEIGTIEPIKELAKEIRRFKKNNKKNSQLPYFHTDASQAAGYCDLNVAGLGVDLMTLDASKIYGPKGVGALFAKRGVALSPVIVGGGQEGGLRSGTENISGIVGFAKALELVEELKEKETKRTAQLRDYFIKSVLKKFKGAKLNGSQSERLPNNANFCFPALDAEFAVIKLDALGIMCSSGSSCRTLEENQNSHVLENIGKGECASSSLRFSFGRTTTKRDLDTVLTALAKVVNV